MFATATTIASSAIDEVPLEEYDDFPPAPAAPLMSNASTQTSPTSASVDVADSVGTMFPPLPPTAFTPPAPTSTSSTVPHPYANRRRSLFESMISSPYLQSAAAASASTSSSSTIAGSARTSSEGMTGESGDASQEAGYNNSVNNSTGAIAVRNQSYSSPGLGYGQHEASQNLDSAGEAGDSSYYSLSDSADHDNSMTDDGLPPPPTEIFADGETEAGFYANGTLTNPL